MCSKKGRAEGTQKEGMKCSTAHMGKGYRHKPAKAWGGEGKKVVCGRQVKGRKGRQSGKAKAGTRDREKQKGQWGKKGAGKVKVWGNGRRYKRRREGEGGGKARCVQAATRVCVCARCVCGGGMRV